jgi:hypothetical protein
LRIPSTQRDSRSLSSFVGTIMLTDGSTSRL